ncbi:MAG: ABC transporter ATP-binding protein [Acidobacteria bacterium]|nr:ABC transporter ATP-binding protein [Acidobacteriota bacterium]
MHEEEVLGKAYDGRLMRRLLRYMIPYRKVTALAFFCILVSSLLQVIPPYLLKVEVDRYLDPTPGPEALGFLDLMLSADPRVGILQIALLLLLPALLLILAFEFVQTYTMQLVGQKIMFDLRQEIFRHLQRLPLSFYDRNPVGRLVTRATSDVEVLNDLFASGVVAIFGDFFTLFGIMIVMLTINWRLALLAFAVIPLIVLTTMAFRRTVRESYRRIRVALARINSYLQEHLSGITVVQLMNREERSFGEFEVVNRDHLKAYKDSIFAYGLFFPAVEFFGVLAVAIVLWFGGGLAADSVVSLGVLLAFIQYSQRFYRPIQDLSDKYNILQTAMASSERIFNLLDTPVAITDPDQPEVLPEALPAGGGRVEFRNVSFAYQGSNQVLDQVSFTIQPGETVAVVGHTGAGKTTLTNLLLRFYDVDEGSILLDGVDIRRLRQEDLRRNFAVVLQDPYLFSGTLESNVRLGTEGIDREAVRRAVRRVRLDAYIERLPEGYLSPVTERSAALSVGQKQLLSYARALAHDPKILILDEATSSVDPETEYAVRRGVHELLRDRTALVIAHRLSTIQNADKIIVLHKGRIREVGAHSELMAQRGFYHKLYELQYKQQEPLAAKETAG